jgi:hypothetical protein
MNNTTSMNYGHRRSIIQDGDQILESAGQHLSAACIAQWVQRRPSATAVLTLEGGDEIRLPVYALRRRDAVVADLPDAPLGITAL